MNVHTSLITDGPIEAFASVGFGVCRDAIDPTLIDALYRSIVVVLAAHDPGAAHLVDSKVAWRTPEFHTRMRALRAERPDDFGALYDSLQTSTALYALLSSPRLIEAAAKILDRPASHLSASGHMLRMDSRESVRNKLQWHQEASYYWQNVDGNRSVVVWIPMHELDREHGPIEICPTSHLAGHITIATSGKPDYGTSEQYEIPPEIVAKYQPATVMPRPGDALLFHMFMFHRSGDNTCDESRFVAGVRFHTMTADDFLPGRPQYMANGKVLAKRNARFGRNDT